MRCFLCIDIGSSSVRCSAYSLSVTSQGTHLDLIQGSRFQSEYAFDPDGNVPIVRIEQHVNTTLEQSLQALQNRRPHKNNKVEDEEKGVRVVGVGFATFAMNMVGLDESGCAITRVLTYASHGADLARISSELEQKFRLAADENLLKPTGTPAFHTSYAPVKLLHLGRTAEGVAAMKDVHRWSTIASYFIRKWSGDDSLHSISYSEASWTGMFDFRKKCWHLPILEMLPGQALACHVPQGEATKPNIVASDVDKEVWRYDKLPKPCSNLDSGRKFSSEMAHRHPVLEGCKLFLGVADGVAANIGSSCVDSSRMLVTVGTSAAVRVMMKYEEIEKVPKGLWCYAVDERRCLLGGALTDGGSVFEWVCRLAGVEGKEELNALQEKAMRVAPGSHGLVVLPFLSGERSTGWNAQMKMTIAGVTRETRPEEILKAGLEGVAIRLKRILEKLVRARKEDSGFRVVCNGKALLRSRVLKETFAELTGLELFVLKNEEKEHTSLGAARKMLEDSKLGQLGSHEGDLVSAYAPDATRQILYKEMEQAHDRLYSLSQAFYSSS